MYFNLKDEEAIINAVFFKWKNQYLRFKPEDGLKVIANGRVSIYAPQSRYQIVIDRLVPVGEGDLQIAFRQLQAKLEAEGIFAAEHKKPLLTLPKVVGVITSPDGAAIHDIIKVAELRFPNIPIIVFPAAVQGVDAPKELTNGINYFNKKKNVDVIIIGRGGGSLEDLWAFNDEQLVRAIYNSNIPVVSAVGHEVDVSLCDLVADVRAATPSAAAELVFPDASEYQLQLEQYQTLLSKTMKATLQDYHNQVQNHAQKINLNRIKDKLEYSTQRLDDFHLRINQGIRTYLKHQSNSLNTQSSNLQALNPYAVLKRGYAILSDAKTDKLITSVTQIQPAATIKAKLHDGEVVAKVEEKKSS